MFVYTLKATTLKYIGVMTLCVAAIVVTVALVPSTSATRYDTENLQTVAPLSNVKNIKKRSDRTDFLKGYGIEVDADSESVKSVIIPEDFDEVYSAYNELQLSQGFNLEKYKGKEVKCYTYDVTNYGEGTPAVANLMIYKNRVIGGDVSSAEINGFQHGFVKT